MGLLFVFDRNLIKYFYSIMVSPVLYYRISWLCHFLLRAINVYKEDSDQMSPQIVFLFWMNCGRKFMRKVLKIYWKQITQISRIVGALQWCDFTVQITFSLLFSFSFDFLRLQIQKIYSILIKNNTNSKVGYFFFGIFSCFMNYKHSWMRRYAKWNSLFSNIHLGK